MCLLSIDAINLPLNLFLCTIGLFYLMIQPYYDLIQISDFYSLFIYLFNDFMTILGKAIPLIAERRSFGIPLSDEVIQQFKQFVKACNGGVLPVVIKFS